MKAFDADLHDLKCLDSVGVWNMRADAQVN